MGQVLPTENYYYLQQTQIRNELLSTLARYRNTDYTLLITAFHLRYIFMVTRGYETAPPFPAERLHKIRAFLADSYINPHRTIELTGAQMGQILDGIRGYRIYNRDNYDIVMRHITHWDETCGLLNDELSAPCLEEGPILESVLALIPDAQPPKV